MNRMTLHLLAGTSLLALVAVETAAHAKPLIYTFDYTGNGVNFVVHRAAPTKSSPSVPRAEAQRAAALAALGPGPPAISAWARAKTC